MLPGMWRVFGGAVVVVAGIAAFIEAHSHHPVAATVLSTEPRIARAEQAAGVAPESASGLSSTAYDLLRIGAWALVIIGALLIIVGLIGYWGRTKRPA
jgi:hypothetical protein